MVASQATDSLSASTSLPVHAALRSALRSALLKARLDGAPERVGAVEEVPELHVDVGVPRAEERLGGIERRQGEAEGVVGGEGRAAAQGGVR